MRPGVRSVSAQLKEAPAKLPRPARSARRERDPRGDRYNRNSAFMPAQGLASSASPRNVPTLAGAVADPYEPGGRIQVSINRRVDLLEEQRSHKRISVSEFETGRQVQAIIERASGAGLGSGGWGAGGSRDQTVAHEIAIIYAVEDARLIQQLMSRIVQAVGSVGARMLRDLLGGTMSLRQYAEARGKSGERGVAAVGAQFQFLLQALDESFSAFGVAQEIRAFQGEKTGEETDARGVVVPKGHGYRWGRKRAAS